ncbi:MFS transporter [Alkalihalobacillus sp. TS-13]|uniref:MFS transporter n=1 Tax=Alkalihalobacillus sp. TS-13 TaxID=2842455 RepID=UPI001C88D510|nr:MFS transporter [Alkalihalobacillus sp. TS-13]
MSPDTQASILSGIIRSWLLKGPILVAFLLYIGANPLHISIVLGMTSIVKPIQWFVPRLMHTFPNRKRMFILSDFFEFFFLIAAGPIALIMPNHLRLPVFMASFLLSTIFMSVSISYWTSLISDAVPEGKQGTYFGNRQMLAFTSGSLAVITGGIILDRMDETMGFCLLFIASAALMIFRMFILRQYPNPLFERSTETSLFRMMQKPFADRPFMKMTVFLAGFMFILHFISVQLSFITFNVLGIDPYWASVMFAIFAGAHMASSYVWGRLTQRYPTRTLLILSLVFMALGWMLFAGLVVMPALVLLVWVNILYGIGHGGIQLFSLLYRIDTPRSERPAYSGMFNTITGLTGFMGGFLGGIVYNQTASVRLQSIEIPVISGILLMVLALLSPYAIPHRNTKERYESNLQQLQRKLSRQLFLQEKRSHLRSNRRAWQLSRMERRLNRLKQRLG